MLNDRIAALSTNAQGQAAAFRHGIDGVENQVKTGLLELLGVGVDGRAGRLVVDVRIDVVAGQLWAQKPRMSSTSARAGSNTRNGGLGFGEVEKLGDQVVDPADFADHVFQVTLVGFR